jgi:glycosyltransferase involved in cell wall biosynthesis
MTNKPRISVIVPVYNAASTLDMSIGSLVGDQFKDMSPESWEIVAVDDGSADGSLETLRKYVYVE